VGNFAPWELPFWVNSCGRVATLLDASEGSSVCMISSLRNAVYMYMKRIQRRA